MGGRAGERADDALQEQKVPRLILVRHGQSQWNLENRFTGWWDVDLTAKGEDEARAAGALLRAKGMLPSLAFTSLQTRAIRTLHLALEVAGRGSGPVMHRRKAENNAPALTCLFTFGKRQCRLVLTRLCLAPH